MIGFVRLQPIEQELAQMPEEAEADAFPHYKGFWTRASSYLLDLVFLPLLLWFVSFVGWGLLWALAPGTVLALPLEDGDAMAAAFALYGPLSFFLYFGVFEWLVGATPSKLIHKMRVVKIDGAPCGPIAALVRVLMRVVDGFFFGVVAAISMNSPLHQRLGDRLARTVVVAAGDPLIRAPRSWTRFVAALLLYLVLALSLFVLAVLMMARVTPIYLGGASI